MQPYRASIYQSFTKGFAGLQEESMTVPQKIRSLLVAWLDFRIAAARLRIRGGALNVR
jgi:hypothetical protein